MVTIFSVMLSAVTTESYGHIVSTPHGVVSRNAGSVFKIASTSKVFHSYYLLKSTFTPATTFKTALYATLPPDEHARTNLIVDNTNGNYGLFDENTARWTNGCNHVYTSLFRRLDLVTRDPSAGIRKLARDFKNLFNVQSWTGKLIFEHPFDDSQSQSAVPALMINDNLIDVIVHPDLTVQVVPGEIFEVNSNLEHCYSPSCTSVSFSVNFNQWTVGVTGQVWVDLNKTIPHTKTIYEKNTPKIPELVFERIFVDELLKLGVEVELYDVGGTQRIFVTDITSKPFSEFLKEYLYQSLNTMGDYFSLIKSKIFPIALDYLNKFYNDKYPSRWVNFNGLSGGPGNRANISIIYEFFSEISSDQDYPTIFSALPIVGKQGTLSGENFRSPASLVGIVHAKSGNNIISGRNSIADFCIAGYVNTSSGFAPLVTVVNDFAIPRYDGNNIEEILVEVSNNQHSVMVEVASILGVSAENFDSSSPIIGKNSALPLIIFGLFAIGCSSIILVNVLLFYRKFKSRHGSEETQLLEI